MGLVVFKLEVEVLVMIDYMTIYDFFKKEEVGK
jgi:hypothetical protein